MSSDFPNFDAPYVDVEDLVQGLELSDRSLFSFCVDAAIGMVNGKPLAEIEHELVAKGLSPEKAREAIAAVLARKRWKVRWNGIVTLLSGILLFAAGVGCAVGGLLIGYTGLLPYGLIATGLGFIAVGVYRFFVGIARMVAG